VEAAALWRDLAAPRLRPQAIQQVMDATQRHRLHVSIPGDPEWPEGFIIGGVSPPLAVRVLGEVAVLRTPVRGLVTLTGSRAASSYGGFVATELATGAAERGGIVVGGGAHGIEAAAHRGAPNAGGKTIAVLAGGLDKPYPAGPQQLFERIAANGVLLSEIPPGCAPTRLRFVQRARLLAALSDTSIIVEAGVRSGSLLVGPPAPPRSAAMSGRARPDHERLQLRPARAAVQRHRAHHHGSPRHPATGAPGLGRSERTQRPDRPHRADRRDRALLRAEPGIAGRHGTGRQPPAFVAATPAATVSDNAPRL